MITAGILAAGALCALRVVYRWKGNASFQVVRQRFSLFKSRVARMCAPRRSGLAETLLVDLQSAEFSDPDVHDECRGVVRVLVTNTSDFRVERLVVNVRFDSLVCGSFHTARERYDLSLAPGEIASLELAVGFVHRTLLADGYETHVQVIGAHHVACEVPMYVLPESSSGVCSIGESFRITSDLSVERISISMKRRIFRRSGQVNVSYVLRNQGEVFHEGMSLMTRLLSTSGRGIAHHHTTFNVMPWGEKRVSCVLNVERISQLTAARFAATVRGFEDIAIGVGECSQLRAGQGDAHGAEHEELHGEEWHGEVVRDALWIERGTQRE